jgi:hypothetical protein
MKTIVTILLSGISLLAFGQPGSDQGPGINRQQLIGVWQEGSATMGDALRKNFQFFSDGHFVLNFSQYDDIATVRALGGKYKLDSSGLYLIAEYRKEIVGGTYEKGNPGASTRYPPMGSWSRNSPPLPGLPTGSIFRLTPPADEQCWKYSTLIITAMAVSGGWSATKRLQPATMDRVRLDNSKKPTPADYGAQ